MKTLKDGLKTDVSGKLAPQHVNLLIQKTTADDDHQSTGNIEYRPNLPGWPKI